jgi:hypothetical protein
MLFAVLFVVAFLLAVYIFIVRPILIHQPAMSAAFKAEAAFADKVRAKIVGWRTRIAARAVMISSGFVWLYDTALPIATGQDWTPVTDAIPKWAMPVGLFAVGLLFAYLRRISDNPPQLVTQKDDAGEAKIVAVIAPQ